MNATNVPVNWADTLAKHAKEAAAVERPSSENISVRGGHMVLNGQPVPNSELDCIVVASVFENQYYDPSKPFDPDNLQNPICFSQSLTGEDMVPDPRSTQIQSKTTCAELPVMKSAHPPRKQRGKAWAVPKTWPPPGLANQGRQGRRDQKVKCGCPLTCRHLYQELVELRKLLAQRARPPALCDADDCPFKAAPTVSAGASCCAQSGFVIDGI